MEQKIIVYLECTSDQIAKVSLEALNAALQLAAQKGAQVCALTVNAPEAAPVAAVYGAHQVIAAQWGDFQPEAYAAALADLCVKYETELLFLGATRDGKDLAARVAAQLEVGCVTDAVALTEEGAFLRSVYGGSLQETVAVPGKAVISVRSGSFGKPEADLSRTAPVIEETAAQAEVRAVIREAVQELTATVDLEAAEVIVAGGRGMGSAENFKLVEELAELLGGVVGASRPAIESGWVARNHQVGQSGKTVAPKLYIACGISGAIQHVSGMSGSGFIVAVNKDADAPIFEVADVGIVGNVTEILPLMIQEIKSRKA